jgi:hypothetical protein
MGENMPGDPIGTPPDAVPTVTGSPWPRKSQRVTYGFGIIRWASRGLRGLPNLGMPLRSRGNIEGRTDITE